MSVNEEVQELQELQKYLIVRIDREVYAVGIEKVLEILTRHKITRMPRVPSYIKGIMNLRGQILPVVDLIEVFNDLHSAKESRNCFIVTEISGSKIAIMADEVVEVKEADPASIQKETTRDAKEYIEGILLDDDSSYIVLDLENLLPPLAS